MNQATKEFRQKLAEAFIKSLSENGLSWKKGWQGSEGIRMPINAYTGKAYKGINRFFLYLNALDSQTHDNRWATFKQIQTRGWKLKKGSKGCRVEYWQPYNYQAKSPIPWEDYLLIQGEEGIGLIAKYYVVFNGKDIEGIPNPEGSHKENGRTILTDTVIDNISTGMGIDISNDGGDNAYYNILDDSIHMPPKHAFCSSYEYDVTALHELTHASGAPGRLNRQIGNAFGTDQYAYEELVAEITSCFMAEHLEIRQTQEHIQNHKAYVKSWISGIKEKPEELIRAIRDVNNAASYLEFNAGILTRDEYLESTRESLEVPQGIVQGQETGKPASKPGRGIMRDLRANGYVPTNKLVKELTALNKVTGKATTVEEIRAMLASRSNKGGDGADKILNNIGKCLRMQEMAMEQAIPSPR